MVDFTDAQKQWLQWLRELGIETADATPELVGASASVRGEPTPPDRPEPKAGTQSDASTSGGETTPKMSVPLSENVVGGPGGGPSDGSGPGGGNDGDPPPKKKLSAKDRRKQDQEREQRRKGGESPAEKVGPDEGPMNHPEIGEDKIPLDEALKAAGVEMNEAEREAFGDWIMERHGIGHGKHYTRHPASLDKLRGDVKDFRAERSTKKTGAAAEIRRADTEPSLHRSPNLTIPERRRDTETVARPRKNLLLSRLLQVTPTLNRRNRNSLARPKRSTNCRRIPSSMSDRSASRPRPWKPKRKLWPRNFGSIRRWPTFPDQPPRSSSPACAGSFVRCASGAAASSCSP